MTLRKDVVLEPPFRFIEKDDANKRFENDFLSLNRIDLEYLASINKNDLYVIVREVEEAVGGFIVLKDLETHFEIKLVELNRDPSIPDIKTGAELIIYVEKICRQFNYKKIDSIR